MPLPMVNLISGGLHAGRNLDMQDFLMVPVGATSYRQALDWIVTVYHALGRTLTQHQHEGTLVGDEGGYGPKLARHETAIELILEAVVARTPRWLLAATWALLLGGILLTPGNGNAFIYFQF